MKCKECVHYKLCRDLFCQVDTLNDDDKKCDYYEPTRPHGKWIIVDDCEKFIARCSVCGRILDSRMVKDYPFCRCGADMRPKEGEKK